VDHSTCAYAIGERRAIGCPNSPARHTAIAVAAMHERRCVVGCDIAAARVRYGYRQIRVLLQCEGLR
jgi:hypothetical protein